MGTERSRAESRWPRRDLPAALVALGAAAVLAFAVRGVALQTNDSGSLIFITAGYLAFWVPLIAAAIVVRNRKWDGRGRVRWTLKPIDLLWGFGAGLVLRVVASGIEMLMRGSATLPIMSVPIGVSDSQRILFAISLLVVPVLVAPVIEELFFRGTLLSSLLRTGASTVMRVMAVAVTTVLFAIPHALQASVVLDAGVNFVTTLVFGAGAGVLAVTTKRLGAPLLAHIAFNGALALTVLV
ncbi:CPBP family intramembrane metalloprotease [Antiquaquibacter oligotrophicus]|nr:type II CAAX endopeptidase family protein [Antiquaquibacter oligotrophicus]UDF12444.1 CPBP family intramembrane metalloprotease [Antiquaquibacter oligotrophicus]